MAPEAIQSAQHWADSVSGSTRSPERASRAAIVRTARLLGGAMVTILLIAVVLNEVFTAVNVGSGPFSSIGTDLTTTGVAAVSLLVVGLIVVAANRLMNIFGGAGGGGM